MNMIAMRLEHPLLVGKALPLDSIPPGEASFLIHTPTTAYL
jgi:hypothetical protein